MGFGVSLPVALHGGNNDQSAAAWTTSLRVCAIPSLTGLRSWPNCQPGLHQHPSKVCRKARCLDAPSLGLLFMHKENTTDCPVGVHAIESRMLWVRIPPAQVLTPRCSSTVERRKSLWPNTSSVVLFGWGWGWGFGAGVLGVLAPSVIEANSLASSWDLAGVRDSDNLIPLTDIQARACVYWCQLDNSPPFRFQHLTPEH
jgi:hypothetical protein